MTSPFAQAWAAADVVLDGHFGETVQITPMRSSDFARVPDGDRPAFDVEALVYWDDQASIDVPKLTTRVVAESWTIEIRRALLAGRTVHKGDEIILLDQPNSPTVVVAHVENQDRERMTFVCSSAAV